MNLAENWMAYLIYILVFITVILVMEIIFLSAWRHATYRKKVTSRLLDVPGEEPQKAEPSNPELQYLRQHSTTLPGYNTLEKLLVQAGIKWSVPKFAAVLIILSVIALMIPVLMGFSFLFGVTIAVLIGLVTPLIILQFLQVRRTSKFESQLPDAIDIVVRSLKAGHPVSVAIKLVSEEMSDPLRTEFQQVAEELTFGLDLESALTNLRSRVPQADLSLLIVAVSIHAKLGGNLIEILSNLSKVIRGRFKMRRKALALSAEGRVSAVILSLLPVFLFFILAFISPNFYGDVWQNPYVKPVLFIAGIWMLIGDVIMYRLVKFEI